MGTEPLPPGVTYLDHTADVGLEARAPSLEELFRRAAAGMVLLVEGEDGGPSASEPDERALTLGAHDLAGLLRGWLRELLWWHDADGVGFRGARFDRLDETGLEASVSVAPSARVPVREIKGVTLHGLEAVREGDGWRARVIFDV